MGVFFIRKYGLIRLQIHTNITQLANRSQLELQEQEWARQTGDRLGDGGERHAWPLCKAETDKRLTADTCVEGLVGGVGEGGGGGVRRRLLSPARVRQPGVTGSGGSRDVDAAKRCGGTAHLFGRRLSDDGGEVTGGQDRRRRDSSSMALTSRWMDQ